MILRIAISILIIYFLPALFTIILPKPGADTTIQTPAVLQTIEDNDADPEQTETVTENLIYVDVLTSEGVMQMELEEYVLGVVLGEMPAEFELEALKAQAVVARTYTCKMGEDPKHDTAQICTDPGCCQMYMSEMAYRNAGGSETDIVKVKSAVDATKGQVLKYQGKLIEATYFSCSGGRTEDARAVWGTDVPYLQSVSSPGEENASHYRDTVRFTVSEFSDKLGNTLPGSPASWIGTVIYTEGGGVSTVSIGNRIYTGVELRRLLSLRSTAFTISCHADSIEIVTKGYGHRVGMSQYGADAMALSGSRYDEILYHYYQGTVLSDLSG